MATKSLAELYKDSKRRLDARQVLEHYGAENVTETRSDRYGPTLVHSCLLDRVEPHHANGDAHPSAWVNVETGLYCCSVYWTGDLFHLIQKLEGQEDLRDIMPTVGGMLAGARDSVQYQAEIEALFADPVYSVDIPGYDERVLNPWLKIHPYMRDVRGISAEAHQELMIGYDDRANRIVFPHWWQGKLVGWQKRAIPTIIDDDDRPLWPGTEVPYPKYKNSSGFPKSETLYNYDAVKMCGERDIVVVESPMSVAKGVVLQQRNVVATFGASVSKEHIRLLRDFDRVTVWFDDDTAGQKGERKLIEGLYRHTDVQVIESDPGMDLGDYNDADRVRRKLESARPAYEWLAWYGGPDGHKQESRARQG